MDIYPSIYPSIYLIYLSIFLSFFLSTSIYLQDEATHSYKSLYQPSTIAGAASGLRRPGRPGASSSPAPRRLRSLPLGTAKQAMKGGPWAMVS